MNLEDDKCDVDILEMLLQAAETGTVVLGVDYPSIKKCELWEIPLPE